MSILTYDVKTCQQDSLRLLHQLGLVEWEQAHHWSQFEEHVLGAQHHLILYVEACCRRQEVVNALNTALTPVLAEVAR